MLRRSFLKLLSAVPFASVLAWPDAEEDPPATLEVHNMRSVDPATYPGTAASSFNDFVEATGPKYISSVDEFVNESYRQAYFFERLVS